MPKQLNVNLAFTADTHEAKAQLASLQQDLNRLTQSASTKSPLGITKDLSSAVGEVNKLQAALKNATTSSGKLDLGQFRRELGTANLDAHKIAETLNELGPEGQAAFAKLAQSVTLAEVPLKKVNNTLTQFATTLANTARWQISSSILHGFMGALQGAYRYAQDLNKSLNSIRVVTGQSTDQMAEFAKHANESAKALSATTTAYTDASLIFFQQGLTGDAVTERTDAVIKMSNVTGDSVEDVASYMTAIWNNFDDGSQSLEHFADVITALGAATAASSAEISQGLEKFASIADTVGLSYDYATSALATVVATTRQSADTVGTAFKTIFARIQGLKLGETLEDGVDLNKYSEALNSVGVQVLDLSGNMRDLDDILDDLAARWKMLSSAQQTALAQTVAGTRQYNQLVALMSNWDFMEENLEVAKNAEGSLQKQADIYAESWEAAQKRVKAAWQEIYAQLLDDKFFINLTNGFSKVLSEISNVIDAFNGLKGIVPLLTSALLGLFNKQISSSLENFVQNLQIAHGGMQAIIEERQKFNQELVAININTADPTLARLGDLYAEQGRIQDELIKKSVELQNNNRNLTDQEQQLVQVYQQQLNKLTEIYQKKEEIALADNAAAIEAERFASLNVSRDTYTSLGVKNQNDWSNLVSEASANSQALNDLLNLVNEIQRVSQDGIIPESAKQSIAELVQQIGYARGEFKDFPASIQRIYDALVELGGENSASVNIEELSTKIRKLFSGNNMVPTVEGLTRSIKKLGSEAKDDVSAMENLGKAIQKASMSASDADKALVSTQAGLARYRRFVDELSGTLATVPERIVAGARAMSSFAMSLNAITGLIDTLNNPDTSGLDKLVASLTSLGMVVPMIGSAIKSLNTTFGINLLAVKANAVAVEGLVDVLRGKSVTLYNNIAAEKLNTLAEKEGTAELAKRLFGEKALVDAEQQGITVESIKLALDQNGIKLSALQLGALVKRILGEEALNEELKKRIVLETLLKGLAGFGIMGVTAGIMAAVAAVKLYDQHLKNVADHSSEVAEQQKKITDGYSAEADKVNNLADAYNDLRKQQEDGSISQADLTIQVAKLAEEYDNQRVAILNLAGAYGDLDVAIRNMQDSANEELFKSSGTDVTNYRTALRDQLISIADSRKDNFGDTIDLKGMVDRDINEQAFADALKEIEIQFASSDHIYTDDLVNAIIYHKDELDRILATYSETEAAHQILGYIEQLTSNIQNATESLERYQESALSLAFNQNFDKNNFNIISFMEKMRQDERVQAARITDEQVRDWVLKQIEGINEVSDYAQSYQIAFSLYNQDITEEQLDNLADQIKDFNNSDKALIMLYPTLAGDYIDNNGKIDLDQLREDFENQLNYTEGKGNASAAMSFMSEFNEKGSFSDINSVADLLGIDVNKFTDEEIYNKLDEFYQTSLEHANQYYEQALKEASDFAEEMNSEILSRVPSQEDVDAYFEEVYDKFKNGRTWEYASEEQVDALTDKYTNQFKDFIEEYSEAIRDGGAISEDLVNTLETLYNVYGEETINELIEGYASLNPEVGEFEEKLSEANTMLSSTTELTIDWVGKAQGLQTRIKGINKDIDNLQAAYKEFAAAQKEFNEKGYYSVDTIQSLLNLSPEYLQYITIEDDQIKIASQDIADQQNAYYDLLEAKYADYFLTQARIITEGEENQALYEQTLRTWQLNFAQASANTTMDSAIGIVKDLASAYAEGSAEAEAFANILSTMDKFEGLINAGRNSINKNPEGAMNATPKGGGSGSKDVKELKEYIKEFDKLYSIKKALEDLADAISDLDKKKSHLMGQSLVESLQQENELLSQQRDLYEELLRQQGDYRDELAGALQQFGATFDSSTGNLTNYLEITQAALDKYNAAVAAYNSSHDKGAFSVADQEYKYFKEVLSAYQTILTDMTDTQNKLDDNFLQQIENNLKSFEAEIKVDLDFDEAQRKVNDFFKNINSNFKKMYKSTKEWAELFTTATKNVDTYTKGAGSTIETDLRALQEVASFIDNKGYDNDDPNRLFASRDDAIAKYKELSEQLMSDAQDLYELYEDTWSNYLDAIDEVKSQWNDILKGFDKVNSTLKHYEKVAELLYGGSEYSTGREYLDQIYAESSRNSIAKQDALRKEIDALREEYDQILSTGVEETDEDLVKLKEAIQEAESSLESEIENYLSTIQNQLTNSIKSIMDTANRNMTRGHGVDLIIERWNDAKDAAEGYYDEVERVYELEKLESEWEDVISSTSTLKNQQYLTSIMNEQLKNLRDKTKLSEYDIGLAEKELAIYQAQMALEDARNNKNAMKVVRNERGDWAYQYVADEDDVASKEEDLMNKTYEKYEYVKNASNEATEALLQLYQTAQERLSELLEEYKYADEARRLEIAEQYNYLYDYYYGPEGLIMQKASETHAMEDDLNIAGMELVWELYEKDINNYSLMIESEKALIDDLRNHNIQSFTELVTAVATGDDSLYNQLLDRVTEVTNDSRTQWQELAHEIIGDWATNPDSVRAAVTFAYDSIMEKVAQYDLAIALSEQISGIAWTNITARVNETEIAVQQVENAIWNVIDQTSALSGFRAEVDAMGNAWISVRAKIMDAVGALQGYLSLLGQASQVRIPEYNIPLNPTPSNKKWQPEGNPGSGGGPSGNQNTPEGYIIVGQDTHGHDNALISNNHGMGYATIEEAEAAATQMYNEAMGGLGNLRVEPMGYYIENNMPTGYVPMTGRGIESNRTGLADEFSFGALGLQIPGGHPGAFGTLVDIERMIANDVARSSNSPALISGGASALLNSMGTSTNNSTIINIENLQAPNVTNADELAHFFDTSITEITNPS